MCGLLFHNFKSAYMAYVTLNPAQLITVDAKYNKVICKARLNLSWQRERYKYNTKGGRGGECACGQAALWPL